MIPNLFAGLMLIASIFVGLLAIPFMTQATLGVGCMAGACLLGILARLFQADGHHSKSCKNHKEVMEALQKLSGEVKS
jgi:hypothetical protein